MKNIYIRPITECYNIETIHIIANSIAKDKDHPIINLDDFEIFSRENNTHNPQNPWDNEW